MDLSSRFDRIEELIVRDERCAFTLASLVIVCTIFANLSEVQSPVIGAITFFFYFSINGVFLGHAFFEKETAFFRRTFGFLLLIMLLSFVGWLAVVIYNLDVIRLTLVLLMVATLSSLLNRRVKSKNAT